MRSLKKLAFLSLAVALLSFGPVYAQSGSTQTLERQIQKKILQLPYYEVFDYIGFTVDDGTVTLTGKVLNGTNKKGAERAVRNLPGVTRVVNNIELLPGGSFDQRIRRSLYRDLAQTGLSRYLWPTNPSVRLIVDGGRISLEGYVASRGDRDMMNVIANGVPGTFSVTNNLKVDSGRAN